MASFKARSVFIMADAGLTHGGFYAHFASKEELLGAALAHAGGQTLDELARVLGAAEGAAAFGAVVDAYLSPEHAAHPERGCPVAALGPEVARASGKTRRELADGLRRRIDWMRALLPKRRRGRAHEDHVIGTLACMVGGLILARTLGGKESAAVLESCRAFLHRSLDDGG